MTSGEKKRSGIGVLPSAGPNAEQIQYWNALAGRTWVAFQPFIDRQLGPLGHRVMDRLELRQGERVLDVGCGCGGCSVELARRVGPQGSITGLDLSSVMLERAHETAGAAGLANVTFVAADAQTHPFAPDAFDVVFSRLGVMFFGDPVAAFANLRRALRPGVRLGFACWQTLPRNTWMQVPLQAAAPYLPTPTPPAPGAPSPFAFADPDRVRTVLTGAGWVEIGIEPLEEILSLGGGCSLDETVAVLLHIGPLGRALVGAPDELRARIAGAVREAVAPFMTAEGARMAAAGWLVTARRP